MANTSPSTARLEGWLQRMHAGDAAARDQLLEHVCERLRRLTRKMLKGFPGVKRYAETDDVLQNALMRLLRALQEVRPASAREFLGLAAVQIRRELIDLARHYQGPEGPGRQRAGGLGPESSASPIGPPDPGTDTDDPALLAAWTEFHHQVEALPVEEKEIFDLLWYQGLPKAEAAALLGVTERVVRYRWQSARVRLHQRLGGRLPG